MNKTAMLHIFVFVINRKYITAEDLYLRLRVAVIQRLST